MQHIIKTYSIRKVYDFLPISHGVYGFTRKVYGFLSGANIRHLDSNLKRAHPILRPRKIKNETKSNHRT